MKTPYLEALEIMENLIKAKTAEQADEAFSKMDWYVKRERKKLRTESLNGNPYEQKTTKNSDGAYTQGQTAC